ncbi:hypothetical protein ACP4OV_011620 [Aristida adscensionis]
MSRLAGSASRASASASAAAVLAIMLLGGLVVVSLVIERSENESMPPVSVPAVVGGRRRITGANGGFADQRTLEGFRDHDPFSSSKRKVPNGPDPIHNSEELESQEDHRAEPRQWRSALPDEWKFPKHLLWIRSLCCKMERGKGKNTGPMFVVGLAWTMMV